MTAERGANSSGPIEERNEGIVTVNASKKLLVIPNSAATLVTPDANMVVAIFLCKGIACVSHMILILFSTETVISRPGSGHHVCPLSSGFHKPVLISSRPARRQKFNIRDLL
jgi:hypothetical protein